MDNGWYENYTGVPCPYIGPSAVQSPPRYPRTYIASTRLDPRPKNGYQPFPILSAIDRDIPTFSNLSFISPTSQLILQPFRRFTYVTAHSPTFFCFSYVTGSSLTSPGEPPMIVLRQLLWPHINLTICCKILAGTSLLVVSSFCSSSRHINMNNFHNLG